MLLPQAAKLHWLCLSFGEYFRVFVITYKALYGLGPASFADMLSYVPSRSLRCSTAGLLDGQSHIHTKAGYLVFSEQFKVTA